MSELLTNSLDLKPEKTISQMLKGNWQDVLKKDFAVLQFLFD